MEVSEQFTVGMKRRQPSFEDFDSSHKSIVKGVDQSKKLIGQNGVCECNCNNTDRHTFCTDRVLPLHGKRTCQSGVSSIQHNERENEIPMEMQYDFFAMQCNNNSSAINLNTTSRTQHQCNPSAASHSSQTYMNSQMEAEVYRQMIPSTARRCQRCISGEPGHINHILSS